MSSCSATWVCGPCLMHKPGTDSTMDGLRAELESLEAKSQLRRLERMEGVNLCSNDYLGLARDPRLAEAVKAALDAGASVASTGSRLLSGNSAAWKNSNQNSRASSVQKRRSFSVPAMPPTWACSAPFSVPMTWFSPTGQTTRA